MSALAGLLARGLAGFLVCLIYWLFAWFHVRQPTRLIARWLGCWVVRLIDCLYLFFFWLVGWFLLPWLIYLLIDRTLAFSIVALIDFLACLLKWLLDCLLDWLVGYLIGRLLCCLHVLAFCLIARSLARLPPVSLACSIDCSILSICTDLIVFFSLFVGLIDLVELIALMDMFAFIVLLSLLVLRTWISYISLIVLFDLWLLCVTALAPRSPWFVLIRLA